MQNRFSRYFGLSLLAVLGTILAQPPAHAQDLGTAGGVIAVEGLVLQRDDIDGTQFTGPDVPGGQFVAIGPDDLDPGWSGGIRITVEPMWLGYRMQFTGFYAGNFKTRKTFTGLDEGPLQTNTTYDDDSHLNPGADVSTSNSDEIHALMLEHRTVLAGSEGNVLLPFGPAGINLLVGTRSLYLAEHLSSIAYDEQDDFNGTDNDIDRVTIATRNFLFGVQIGAEGMFPVSENIKIGGNVKAGLFANRVSRERSFSSDDGTDTIDDSRSGTGFAQVIEVNPRLMVHVMPNTYLTVGGAFMWINGVSEAAEHYSTVTDREDTSLRDNGDVMIYGASAGLVIKLN